MRTWVIGLVVVVLMSIPVYQASAQNNVMINEVELNPPGNDNYRDIVEWIELYNAGNNPVDVSSWTIGSSAGRTESFVIESGTMIPPKGFLVIASGSQWLDNSDEVVVLRDSKGSVIDKADPFSDDGNNKMSWQRFPDGSSNWVFQSSTHEISNDRTTLAAKETVEPTEKASCWIRVSQHSYGIEDMVLITVEVSPVSKEEVTVSIIGPDGSSYLEKRHHANNRGIVEFSFDVKEYHPLGKWIITANYIDAEVRESFNIVSIKASTDKAAYTPGETSLITVEVETVSGGDPHRPITTAQVYSPKLVIIGPDKRTYFEGSPRDDILVDDHGRVKVQFHWEIDDDFPLGEWLVLARYGEVETDVSFKVEVGEVDTQRPKVDFGTLFKAGLDKTGYKAGDTVLVEAKTSPSSKLTILVLDPEEDIYLQDEIRTGEDGYVSYTFKITEHAREGEWSMELITGDDIKTLKFEVFSGFDEPVSIAFPNLQGTALVKNLKKLTLISVKNTGETPISSLAIKVDEGSIRYVKAKHWDRERISDDTVILKPSKEREDKVLKPGDHMIVLIWWKDRLDIKEKISVDLRSLPLYMEELEVSIKELEEKLKDLGDDAQLANVDLQNILQKQQQTLQTISNTSKMLHDTAMAVIRKIG